MNDHDLYLITATAVMTHGATSRMTQIPAFILDPGIQGIVSEQHAEEIACTIIDPFGLVTVHATAVLI